VRRLGQDDVGDTQDRETAGSPSGEPAAHLADVCVRRAAVYEALTYGFSEPTAAYVEALARGEVMEFLGNAITWLRADAAAYDPALATLARAASSTAAAGVEAALHNLQVEYARLFTGPGRPAVMCYASEYLDADERGRGRLNHAAAAFAAAEYKAEGVSLAAARRDLPDHVTTELEFLFHLCRREERAWAAGESDEASRLRRSLDSFLRGHAGLWLPRFAASVRSLTAQEAYSGMAELLSAHLAVELGDAAPIGTARPGS
jgi:putative dimethyl sulfoxide reductase chaperone